MNVIKTEPLMIQQMLICTKPLFSNIHPQEFCIPSYFFFLLQEKFI